MNVDFWSCCLHSSNAIITGLWHEAWDQIQGTLQTELHPEPEEVHFKCLWRYIMDNRCWAKDSLYQNQARRHYESLHDSALSPQFGENGPSPCAGCRVAHTLWLWFVCSGLSLVASHLAFSWKTTKGMGVALRIIPHGGLSLKELPWQPAHSRGLQVAHSSPKKQTAVPLNAQGSQWLGSDRGEQPRKCFSLKVWNVDLDDVGPGIWETHKRWK